jgi:hypothetical protein
MSFIGLLNEKPLHAALKEWYAHPGDRFEVSVDGYVIDLVRGDLLVEIQTGGFSSIKSKLIDLTETYPVRLVYPIPGEKWIVKLAQNVSGRATRRKSPKHGDLIDLFWELVSFPGLVSRSTFSIEVLLTQEDEVRRYTGERRWRRGGWVTEERRLIGVVERAVYHTPFDVATLLPADLETPFTTKDLAQALGRGRRLAQKMAYCLRKMDVIECVGKQGRACLYERVNCSE